MGIFKVVQVLRRLVVFFCPNTKEWDEEHVRLTSSITDVKAVLETRIPHNQCSDRLSWVMTNDGKYSVKSGYHFWKSNSVTPPHMVQTSGWQKLWKLNVP